MSKIIKGASMFLNRHGSKILIGVSIISMGSAIVMGINGRPKYETLINDIKEDETEDLKLKQKVKPVIKAYWPSILLAIFSASCTIGSHIIEKKHQAVLAAALTVSNTALKEFQKKTIEHIGEKKVTEIKDAISKDKIDKKKPTENSIIVTPSKGKVLMLDSYSGRYFYSDIETLRRVVNDINRRIPDEMYCTVNELYVELGLPEIELGNQNGWHIDYNNSFEEVLSAQITDSGEPCIVVSYNPMPSPEGWFCN